MIKVFSTVILDLYGVVLCESRSSFIDYAKENDPNLDTETANALFQKAILGELSSEELLGALGIEEKDFTEGFIKSRLSLNEGFTEFAEKVNGKYDLVLMTNNLAQWNDAILDHFGIKKYFKHIFVSSEMKCAKPSFDIFDRAMEIMGTAPQECIFVDNREKNLLAAEEVGLAPVLFEGENERYYGASVYNFKELADFIG